MRTLLISLLTILLQLSVVYGNLENYGLLDSLRNNQGWSDEKILENGDLIEWKRIEDADLKAVRVTRSVSINPDTIIDVLEDVTSYNRIIQSNKSMNCELIERTEEYIDGYQYLKVPLFKNRHLVFRMFTRENESEPGIVTSSWILLEEENEHNYWLENRQAGKSPVYLEDGAGIWIFDQVDENEFRVSYSLYMNPGGWLPSFILNKVNKNGITGLFADVLNEAERRTNGVN